MTKMSEQTEAIVKSETQALQGPVQEVKAVVLDVPIADPTNDFRVKPPPPCEACGGPAHGPTNQLIDCLMRHIRAARSLVTGGPPRTCAGCGQVHRSADDLVLCLERSLAQARSSKRVGVTEDEFKANQAQSAHFERIRGKNKKGGGG